MEREDDIVEAEWRGKVSAHVVQWMRRLSAVVVVVEKEEEATVSRLIPSPATVLILFLPMLINGGAKSCCCAREAGECAGMALLYFWISQLVEDSPQMWSRWV